MLNAVGIENSHPYALRPSFASLLLREGRSVHYVAKQLGHAARLTIDTYGHVIDELDDAPRLPAIDAILQALDPRSGTPTTRRLRMRDPDVAKAQAWRLSA